MRRWHLRGFTMIELMIGVAILAILLALGLPAFTQMLQNSRLRATAEAFTAGLQRARAEAVKLNAQVELIMTNATPLAANVDSAAPTAGGTNWIVRSVAVNPATGTRDFFEGKSSAEGAAAAVVVTATNTAIAFTAFGATTLAATATFQFTNPTGGACFAAAGPMRCLNVVVMTGGQVKMCDPAIVTVGDTRRC